MSSVQIGSVLAQMQNLAGLAAGNRTDARAAAAVGEGTFAGALRDSLERINALQNQSAEQSRAFQAGEPGVALHDVMISGQKASIAFELGVQVRNRLVSAYRDIMNMQV